MRVRLRTYGLTMYLEMVICSVLHLSKFKGTAEFNLTCQIFISNVIYCHVDATKSVNN